MSSTLTKTNIKYGQPSNHELLHIIIQNYLIDNPSFNGFITLDYKNRIRIRNTTLIPFTFLKQIYFKYINTFQQNNSYIKNKIHKYVINLLQQQEISTSTSKSSITCIGGESYYYPIYINNNEFIYYTNSEDLYNEAVFNTSINFQNHRNIEQFKIIDYNTTNMTKSNNNINLKNETIIINLSKLNKNLIQLINSDDGNNNCKHIIIINCKHKDFWKKITLLTNFKLKERKHFIACNYFITINHFLRK